MNQKVNRLTRFWLLCMIVFIVGLPLAKSQVSPFDLKHKLTKTQKEQAQQELAEPSIKELTEPVVKIDSTDSRSTPEEPTTESILSSTNSDADTLLGDSSTLASNQMGTTEEKNTLPFKSKKNQPLFLFFILIAATILTTLTISSNKNLVNNILRAVLNDNYLNLMYREQKKSSAFHYYILYFVFAVNAGLFLYFLLSQMVFNNSIPMLWRCVVLIGIVYSARHLFMSYLSYVYPFQKELEQYAFTILIFNIFLGLILLPINVFVAFCPEPIANFFLYAGLGIMLIVYIFRQLRGVFISSRLLFNNKFYFLLYLCAVEIAPVLLLVKYFGAYVS